MPLLRYADRVVRTVVEASLRALNDVLEKVGPLDALFLGDSITRFWLPADPGLFLPRWVNRGVSGNTTAAMLQSFRLDQMTRRPRVVHLMGGTNDLWYGSPGPDALGSLANLIEIVERCQTLGICPILASPPPIRREAEHLFANPALFPILRAKIEHYCRAAEVLHVDYAQSLADDAGVLRDSFTTDGVHLTRSGYAAMRSQAEQIVRLALRDCPRRSRPDADT